ncbi:MAG TPA: hypothetical protein VGX92_05675 [Pyrinomonadaceae bacterium]|jgi:hypothetical protein|nr:hypothetical protein [Pyrinomonadaceae bacterium]
MSTVNPTEAESTAQAAKEAPTAQQSSQPGVPKKIINAQTVCNEKNEKGKSCNGFLKQLSTGGEEAKKHLRGDDVLFKCQTCGTLYIGPPLGHVRDPGKQSRFVEKELMAILQAAGGTLPAFKMSERGTLVPVEDNSHHAPAPAAASAANTPPATAAAARKPAPAAAATSTTEAKPAAPPRDSSAEADRHRPAAEAQAATGQASAAPLSPAAATASPAAGAEAVADLAPEASTELTPGAPPDSRAPAPTRPTGATETTQTGTPGEE